MENKGIFSLQDKIQSHRNQWKKLGFSTDKVRHSALTASSFFIAFHYIKSCKKGFRCVKLITKI